VREALMYDLGRLRCAVLALALLTLAADRLRGSETSGFDDVKRHALEQLKSSRSADRIAAIAELAESPEIEAARLIVERGLHDRAPDVRKACLAALLKFKDRREVCADLLQLLDKQFKRHQLGDEEAGLLEIVLASDIVEIEPEVDRFLDRYLAASKDGGALLANMANRWVEQGDEQSVVLLTRMARTKAITGNFAFQRAFVQSLAKIRRPQTIEAMIGMLARTRGEVRADIVQYLTTMTDQKRGVDADSWLDWWREHKATFQFPDPSKPWVERVSLEGFNSYYGLPLFAKRLVFVLDNSGSMSGQRLDSAKEELTSAVMGLNDDVRFAIVVFNSAIDVWHKQLTTATPEAKRNAGQFIAAINAEGSTASYDALEAAFLFDAEAIYFLSDGEPTNGKYVAPDDIVAAICKTNRPRLLSVYSIGIYAGIPGSELDNFMRNLAEQNFGAYKRIDE
jgi:hypothetical protein